MVIKPTILVGLGRAASGVVIRSYEQLVTLNPLLKETVNAIGLDERGTLKPFPSGATVFEGQLSDAVKTSYADGYTAIIEREREIYDYFVASYSQLKALKVGKKLTLQGIDLGDMQVIVVASLYDRAGSVALIPFLRVIDKFSREKDVDNFERHCIGLMPDLESAGDDKTERGPLPESDSSRTELYARTYASLCEIDATLSNPNISKLLSSFFFISNRNAKNDAIGTLEEVTPTIGIYCNMLIRNELSTVFSSTHMYKQVQGKDPLYGSFGLSSLVYPSNKVVETLKASSITDLMAIVAALIERKVNRNEVNSAIISFLSDFDNAKLLHSIIRKTDSGDEIYSDFVHYLTQKHLSVGSLEETNVDGYFGTCEAALREYDERTFNGQFVPALTQRRETLTKALTDQLDSETLGFIEDVDTKHGISYAHAFLGMLTKNDSRYLDGEILGEAKDLDTIEDRELNFYKNKLKAGAVDSEKIRKLETEIQNKESQVKKLKEDRARADRKGEQGVPGMLEITEGKYFNVHGKKIHVRGYTPEDSKGGLKPYEPKGMSPEQMPKTVDLRPLTTSIEDQGDVGSCTANAIAGAYEFLARRNTGKAVDMSRLFIYYNARLQIGKTNEDSGCSIGECTRVLKDKGACFEPTWPYRIDRIFDKPSPQAYEEALKYKVDEALRVPIDLHSMKACLAEGYPFVFGLKLFGGFFDDANLVIPLPTLNEKQSELHGDHAMLCVGYSDYDKVFIVRNSWGSNWRDGGHCYIPFEYLANEEYCHACVQIRTVTDETEIDRKLIWREAGSLFSQVVNKVNQDSIATASTLAERELASLVTEYAKLKTQEDLQNNRVKDPNFRNSIIESEIKGIGEQIDKTKTDAQENAKNLNQRAIRYQQLLDLRDTWTKRLVIFYPAVLIGILLGLFGYAGYQTSFGSIIGTVLKDVEWYAGLTGILILAYAIWAYFKYMAQVGNELKQVRIELKDLKNRKVNLLLQFNRLQADTYTLKYHHTVHSYLLDMLRRVNVWADEQIGNIEKFIQDVLAFKKQQEEFLATVMFEENIFLNSVVERVDIDEYRTKRQNIHEEFFSARGKGPFIDYYRDFLRSKNNTLFWRNLSDYFGGEYHSLQERSIYDMIFDEKGPVFRRCPPDIRVKLLVDCAEPYWHTSIVKGEESHILVRWSSPMSDRLLGVFSTNGISFNQQIDSSDKDVITLISIKNGLPAFDSSLLMECHSVFLAATKAGRPAKEFFIGEDFVDKSFIPLGIVYRNRSVRDTLIEACALGVVTERDDGLYIKAKKIGSDFHASYEFLDSLKGEKDCDALRAAVNVDRIQALDRKEKESIVKGIDEYRTRNNALFLDKEADEVLNRLLRKLA